MPGASSAASGGGGNGGGSTKRRSETSSAGNLTPGSNGGAGAGSALALPALGKEGEAVHQNGASGGDHSSGAAGGTEAKKEQQPSAAVMKMKAEVFEKDRDNFLSAFEKPTQIYRFLRARMLESPIFLQRNLVYMNERMSRSHESRKGFRVDNMLSKKMEKHGQLTSRLPLKSSKAAPGPHTNGPVKYYNVYVMGVTDGQTWHPDTRARVDVCIARVCVNKRKEGADSVTKVFEKSVDLKVFSPSSSKAANEVTIPYPQKCPVVAIPAEFCSLGTNGHSVRSYKLVIRVTIPGKCLKENQMNHLNNRNNNNNDGCEEPKAKRRRSAPAAKDRENYIYGNEMNKGNGGAGGFTGSDKTEDLVIYIGQISMYEKDIPGDKINEVDFDIVLKRTQKGNSNRMSHQRIRREISWESFDEKHSKVLEQTKSAGRTAKVCVAIRASYDARQTPSMMDPPTPILSQNIKKEHGASDDKVSRARQEKQRSVRVIYNFIHGNSNQQQTESRDDFRCSWCSLNCMKLYSLMKHLKLSHPRFHFTFSPIMSGTKIDVTINDSFDGSYSGSAFDLVSQPPGEAFARNGPTKRTEVSSILVSRPKPLKQTLQEFFECDEKDVDQRRTYITGHNRLYHHTSTCLPIHPREIDVDSEGEPDPEWLRVKTTMMIDEFTDVNEGEKELMKLWNLHVMKFNYVGDCQIPFACKRFVELHGKEVIQKNLYRNFCLHLINLYDFGLLTPQGVNTAVELLHSQMREFSTTSLLARDRSSKNHTGLGISMNGLAITESSTSQTINKSFTNANSGGTAVAESSTVTMSSSTTVTLSASGTGSASKTGPSTAKLSASSTTSTTVHHHHHQQHSTSSTSNTASVTTMVSNAQSTLVNGVRKMEAKDGNTKKQTFFWLGGSYDPM